MFTNDRSRGALLSVALLVAMSCLAVGTTADASGVTPTAFVADVLPLDSVQQLRAPGVDRVELTDEDELREADGLPPRYAVPNMVSISPLTSGTWEDLDYSTRLWRLRITSPGEAAPTAENSKAGRSAGSGCTSTWGPGVTNARLKSRGTAPSRVRSM